LTIILPSLCIAHPAFFPQEQNAFISHGIADLLVALGYAQENLALIIGLLNVFGDLKRLKPFTRPDLIAFLSR
jgi:hypothetical protein